MIYKTAKAAGRKKQAVIRQSSKTSDWLKGQPYGLSPMGERYRDWESVRRIGQGEGLFTKAAVAEPDSSRRTLKLPTCKQASEHPRLKIPRPGIWARLVAGIFHAFDRPAIDIQLTVHDCFCSPAVKLEKFGVEYDPGHFKSSRIIWDDAALTGLRCLVSILQDVTPTVFGFCAGEEPRCLGDRGPDAKRYFILCSPGTLGNEEG